MNYRKVISLVLSGVFVLLMFSGCSKNNTKAFTDGFWVADTQLNSSGDFDMDWGMDYGFVFDEKGNALTISRYLWSYEVTDKNTIQIYRSSTDEENVLMFYGSYNDETDILRLDFTKDSALYYDFIDTAEYDFMDGPSSSIPPLYLAHYVDNENNNVLKKLLFEVWSTVLPQELSITKAELQGFDNNKEYKEYRNSLAHIDNDIELFQFQYNFDDFESSNIKILHYYEDDEWKYTPKAYYMDYLENSLVIRSIDSDDSTRYHYDQNVGKLVSDQDEIIYRVTNFTDGV